MRGKRGMHLVHVRNCRWRDTTNDASARAAREARANQCERDLRSSYVLVRDWAASRSFLCFSFCLVVRHVHRGPLTFPAVPSHGRRVHSEARVVLWAVSRAVSPLKRAIPPSASSSRIGAPNRTHRVTISRKRDPPYTVPPASSTRGPHCLLVTVVVILVNIVHQRAS